MFDFVDFLLVHLVISYKIGSVGQRQQEKPTQLTIEPSFMYAQKYKIHNIFNLTKKKKPCVT